MKTQKLKIASIAFTIIIGLNSFVKANNLNDNGSIQYSIKSYIEMIKTNSVNDAKNILSDHVKFNMPVNGKISTHGKKEELAFLAKQNNSVQQCEIVSEVLVQNINYNLVKVSSIYSNFIRVDYVTLVKSNNKWEITDVTTDYE